MEDELREIPAISGHRNTVAGPQTGRFLKEAILMKKLSAVLLSILMVLTCLVPMASATVDKAAVVGGDYSALTDDDVLGIVLDWLDAKIAAKAADFDTFEVEVMGQQISVDIPEITGIDSLMEYKDHLADLEGDFANLDTTNLIGRAASGSDTQFVKNLVQFMADNADTFGKVFRWDDNHFDYGKVGEFITTELAGTEIETFYNDYLIGNNIQEKFIKEIAREMGYEYAKDADGNHTQTFDEILNIGIKEALAPVLKEILTSEESKTAYDAFDLKTTDVYALVKAYVGLLQNDYKEDFDNLLSGFLTALQGMVKVVTAGVNLEPPSVTIADYGTFVAGPYTPGNPDPNSYMPTIYTNSEYKPMIEDALAGLQIDPINVNGTDYNVNVTVTDAAVPEGLKNGEPTALVDGFKMTVAQGADTLMDLGLDFSDIEDAVNAEIANQLPTIQAQVDTAVAQAVASANQIVAGLPAIISGAIGEITGSATINSVTVALAYAGYSTDDSFTMEVTVTPTLDITYGGNVWDYAQYAGITKDKIESDYIQPAIDEYLVNPVATISVTNLNGEIAELAQIETLMSYIDTDAEYDDDLLDVSANYDEYKGVIGQVNHILYGAVDMIMSDAGMADLALEDGDNSNLTDNLQKICSKVSGLFETMKQYISNEDFVSLAASAGISDVFASAHGFNADMVYNMDFSSVENALDCGIRIACDLLAEDDPDSIFYEFHMRVEDLDTLDAIIATTVDMILSKLLAKVDIEGWDYTYTAIDAAAVDAGTITAKDAVMEKVVDIAYEAATFAVPKINGAINDVIADLNADFDLGLGNVNFQLGVDKGANWEATLNALLDRFIDLTDGLTVQHFDKSKGAIEKASDILSAVLPMTSMFSNYNGLVAMDTALFTNAADGDFEALLSYFLVKDDAIAGDGIPVTKALINASDYIVDAFFPDTVEAQLYEANTTVQETFTGNESDQGIAARNMRSINNRKADLIPVACRLLKESDLLKSIACSHTNLVDMENTPATCTTAGTTGGKQCADCGAILEQPTEVPATGHNMVAGTPVAATCTAEGYTIYTCANGCGTTEKKDIVAAKGHNMQVTASKDATCTEAGYKTYTCANGCGETRTETIAAKGHSWGNWVVTKEATEDEEGSQTRTCSVCGATETQTIGKKSTNFFQKIIKSIRDFFNRIINFFKNLF